MAHEAGMWIELRPGGSGVDALFAAHIRMLPLDQRMRFRWGFNNEALLDEARDRQRLFVYAQHTGENVLPEALDEPRMLALRCVRRPSQDSLSLALIGKVSAANKQAAHAAACEYWAALRALFPYDYVLEPATRAAEFRSLCGIDILEAALETTAAVDRQPMGERLVEIRRFDGMLVEGPAAVKLLGKWQTGRRANEQIWRATRGSPRPVVLNISLQSTLLQDYELVAIGEMADAAASLCNSRFSAVRREARWAKARYEEMECSLRQPFSLRVHLIGPYGLPEYLKRAVGSALTYPEREEDTVLPGWQGHVIASSESREAAVRAIRWLEDVPPGDAAMDVRFTRLQFLASPDEACAVLRLPYPPEPGLPGADLT